jgi:hypothetical protein
LPRRRFFVESSGSRDFKQELERYLKQQLSSGKLKSFKIADSRRDNLIQLADMSAGAIARSYRESKRNNARRWRAVLGCKVEMSGKLESAEGDICAPLRASLAVARQAHHTVTVRPARTR